MTITSFLLSNVNEIRGLALVVKYLKVSKCSPMGDTVEYCDKIEWETIE